MKYIVNILRVLVGLLFVFSGLIKANDPTGFSIKLDEYFSVFSSDFEAKQDSFTVTTSTPDGRNSRQYIIPSSRPVLELKSTCDPWKPVPINPDIKDSIYFSDAYIYLDQEKLYTTSLNAKDSNKILLQAQVKISVGKQEVANHSFSFTSFANNDTKQTVDLSKYLKQNSWIVDFMQSLRPYALSIAIFICVIEIVLGLALLIGWAPKLTIALLVLMMLFFTFLTWYSAYYNKVTDCGCFGDAIKLTPWQSFNKDIILSAAILILLFGLKHIKAIFSTPFAVRLITVFTLLSFGFAYYCYHFLPVKNFLKFKEGNDIEKLCKIPPGAPVDTYSNVFIYAKNGVNEEFTLEQLSGRDLKAEGYTFIDRRDKLIKKGYEPEIHDFKIMDESRTQDYVDDFFADSGYKLLIVINEVESANTSTMEELHDILRECKRNDVKVYPLTASNAAAVEAFRHEHQLDIPFYYGDKTNLKSIIRSNPGLVLFKGNVVQKTWPSTRLPTSKRFVKQIL
jgi:uncharacterized membrane protein YphA (DoxX/SURF4 family)